MTNPYPYQAVRNMHIINNNSIAMIDADRETCEQMLEMASNPYFDAACDVLMKAREIAQPVFKNA